MRAYSFFSKLALLTFVFLAPNADAQTKRTNRLQRFKSDEALVKFRPEASPAVRMQALGARGHSLHSPISENGLAHVKLAAGQSVERAVASYASDPSVEFAQPNYIYRIHKAPNDTDYAQQWGFNNTGQRVTSLSGAPDMPWSTDNPGVAGKDMSLEGAWDVTTDCSSVVVAVVDTGVNYNHADLKDNMWNGGSAFPNHGTNIIGNNNDPMDVNGHGTHVAGTIAAVGNNGTGGTGVCWKASIMAVRIADPSGSASTADITSGVNFAVANGAKVINISFGGPSSDPMFEAAIKAAGTSGVLIVVSAGNDSANNDSAGNEVYPCNYPESNLICVAALDQSYQLAPFSNFGTTSVDLGAPGLNVVSTWAGPEALLDPALNSGWTLSNNANGTWAYTNIGSAASPLFALSNPANIFGNNVTYANNADDHAYQTFDLSGAEAITVDAQAYINIEYTKDFLRIYCKAAGGDPVNGGTMLDAITGEAGGTPIPLSYDLTPCAGAGASFGFRFQSDPNTSTDTGVAIDYVSIRKLSLGDTTYNIISGTSMASPHVAGLATMIFAYNPNYTLADVVASLTAGGVDSPALAGKTVTGKAANALGSLSYIQQPTGLTVSKM